MSDPKQYLERLGGLTAGRDPLSIQEITAPAIAALIQYEAEARLQVRHGPNKWSVVEIIAHLADDELVASWRFRQMLERPGCLLPGFDQDKWAAYGRYGEWNSQEAVDLFRLLRNGNLRMLRSLNSEDWMCYGEHAERGLTTVRSLAIHMAGHDLNHLEQIRSLLTDCAVV
jgi:hypothetical protein